MSARLITDHRTGDLVEIVACDVCPADDRDGANIRPMVVEARGRIVEVEVCAECRTSPAVNTVAADRADDRERVLAHTAPDLVEWLDRLHGRSRDECPTCGAPSCDCDRPTNRDEIDRLERRERKRQGGLT